MDCDNCSAQANTEDYFKWVKGRQEVDMGWISVGTFLTLRHREDPARGGFAAHILTPVLDRSVTETVRRFVTVSRKKLGDEMQAILRGAAVFTHISTALQEKQLEARQVLEAYFESLGIPADIQWAAEDTLTQCTFDAEAGQCSTETKPYVRKETV
jgi:hypothetical protein